MTRSLATVEESMKVCKTKNSVTRPDMKNVERDDRRVCHNVWSQQGRGTRVAIHERGVLGTFEKLSSVTLSRS